MGIDVEIFFKATEPLTEIEIDEFSLGVDEPEAGEFPNGATHRISSLAKYYGPGYQRGHWPSICACLMSLFSSEKIDAVWYFGDLHYFGLNNRPLTVDDVLEISRMWMEDRDRPYRRVINTVV